MACRRCLLAAALLPTLALAADFRIRTPNEVDYGELDFESDAVAAGQARSLSAEFGLAPLPGWRAEFELDIEREEGDDPLRVTAGSWENILRFSEPGENWVDVGFDAQYAHGLRRGVGDQLQAGPLLQTDLGRTTHTLDLFLARPVGAGGDNRFTDFNYGWQSRWNLWRWLSPAIELYGDVGAVDHAYGFQAQQLEAGPVATGAILLGRLGKIKYEAGYLFGLTDASPSAVVKWKLEFERPL
jgi:hypothetical protein